MLLVAGEPPERGGASKIEVEKPGRSPELTLSCPVVLSAAVAVVRAAFIRIPLMPVASVLRVTVPKEVHTSTVVTAATAALPTWSAQSMVITYSFIHGMPWSILFTPSSDMSLEPRAPTMIGAYRGSAMSALKFLLFMS